MSLRGGTTRQPPEFTMTSNYAPLLQIEIIQTPNWKRGSFMRLPRAFLPRNDVF